MVENSNELRIMLCREKRSGTRTGTSVIAACGKPHLCLAFHIPPTTACWPALLSPLIVCHILPSYLRVMPPACVHATPADSLRTHDAPRECMALASDMSCAHGYTFPDSTEAYIPAERSYLQKLGTH